jgi:DNA-nicking Smr family endonuclease
MAQIKKQQRRGGGDGKEPGKEPPLNAPFLKARKELMSLVVPVLPPPPPKKKLPPPPPTRAPDEPTLSESELFRREMAGVSKLGEKVAGRELPIEVERQAKVRQSDEAEAYAQLSDLVEGIGVFDIADTDEYIEGIGPGLDRRLLIRLRRGDYSIQGHVDLHGFTREEARIKVEAFLTESRQRNRRCVLIVHGRGLNSKDQIPVLKEAVRVWLTRGRISRSVLCFATARPTDGGTGAVYVLLRR